MFVARPARYARLLFAATLLFLCTLAAPPAHRRPAPRPTVATAVSGAGYPRLANYNGLQYDWQAPFFAGDDLVIARRGAPVRELLRIHPHALTLLYERALQADLTLMQDHYGLTPGNVPPGWWLVTAGSTLAAGVDDAQGVVTVADPRPFAPCQDVLVDGESMHVWSVTGHRLYVERGYDSAPAAHRAGARIAPHYSYRTDLSNCTPDRLRPWSFNLSSLCPRWRGQTWADYLARRVATLVRRDGWRGVFYDNLQDFPPSPEVDVNRDGRADGGIVHGVNVWRAGQRALLERTRRLLPGEPLLVNGDLRIDGLAQGREMEGFPLIPGAALTAGIDAYLYDAEAGQGRTIVNPDSVTRRLPAPASAGLTVGVSLLGAGYAAYDRGWIAHGDPWWFDEYDGGQGSATTRLVEWWETVIPVVHPLRFRPGDEVLLDAEKLRVLRVIPGAPGAPGALVMARGVDGTLADWHLARTSVTTAEQRAAGHGYLGRPLGPAYLVPTDHWTYHPRPIWLLRGPATIDGRPQRVPAQTLDPGMTLRVSSALRYDPDATRLTLLAPPATGAEGLRTLVFSARGPSGAALWLNEGNAGQGHTSVSLVLRAAWHRYVIPVGGAQRFILGVGRAGGTVQITGVRLFGAQAFVLRRDFTRGVVIVNPTDRAQLVHLERPYRRLSGDQDPETNSGRVVRALPIAHYRAAILLRP